jgi:hypothetical protein
MQRICIVKLDKWTCSKVHISPFLFLWQKKGLVCNTFLRYGPVARALVSCSANRSSLLGWFDRVQRFDSMYPLPDLSHLSTIRRLWGMLIYNETNKCLWSNWKCH